MCRPGDLRSEAPVVFLHRGKWKTMYGYVLLVLLDLISALAPASEVGGRASFLVESYSHQVRLTPCPHPCPVLIATLFLVEYYDLHFFFSLVRT